MQPNDGGPPIRANPVIGVVAGVLLIVVIGFGLLYAYRSQVPAVPQVSYSTALSEVQDGRVRQVVIEDGRLVTLSLVDGSQQQVITPDGGTALAQAVADRNRADPAHPIELRASNTGPAGPPFVAVSVLVALLPLLVIIALVLLAAKAFASSRAPERYEALSRVADLRDRGVITEEEFQREKRRILK